VKDCDKYPPVVLTGNKCDLDDSREISQAEGEYLANERGIPFFETSAKTGQNIDHAFFGNKQLNFILTAHVDLHTQLLQRKLCCGNIQAILIQIRQWLHQRDDAFFADCLPPATAYLGSEIDCSD